MKLTEDAQRTADRIIESFRNPATLPAAMKQVFLTVPECPSSRWSFGNRFVVALAGHPDSRGFKQWLEVGRKVKKGEKALSILAPLQKKIETKEIDPETGNPVSIMVTYGFRGMPVFGYAQTEGAELEGVSLRDHFDAVPFLEVAESWGLSTLAYDAKGRGSLGFYRPGKEIGLGVKNLSTWAHELIHAADDRTHKLKGGQHLDQEVVAELGGAILLSMIGRTEDADYGGCWSYVSGYAEREGKEPLSVCLAMINRTCLAVQTVVDEAVKLGLILPA